jgi:F5/8 type C domain
MVRHPRQRPGGALALVAWLAAVSLFLASQFLAGQFLAGQPASAAEVSAPPGGDTDGIRLSTTPSSLRVLAAPCGARSLDVGVRNERATPVYADVLVTPDPPLGVSPEAISSYLPAGYELTVPVTVSAPAGGVDGDTQITLAVGRTGQGERLQVPVSVTNPPQGPGANLALAASVSASSSHGTFPACGAIDGNANQDEWEVATGWNDGTATVFPDWLAVDFDGPREVSRVVVYTLDSSRYPGARFGLKDWDVQILDSAGEWQTVDSVRGNTTAPVTSTFAPVSTTSVRVLALASNDARYSRILEFEVYE